MTNNPIPSLPEGPADGVTQTGWQPIETAPKDGTRIIVGSFRRGDERYGRIRTDWFRQPSDGDGFTGWGQFNSIYYPATHWMPLPPPPQDKTQ